MCSYSWTVSIYVDILQMHERHVQYVIGEFFISAYTLSIVRKKSKDVNQSLSNVHV